MRQFRKDAQSAKVVQCHRSFEDATRPFYLLRPLPKTQTTCHGWAALVAPGVAQTVVQGFACREPVLWSCGSATGAWSLFLRCRNVCEREIPFCGAFVPVVVFTTAAGDPRRSWENVFVVFLNVVKTEKAADFQCRSRRDPFAELSCCCCWRISVSQ